MDGAYFNTNDLCFPFPRGVDDDPGIHFIFLLIEKKDTQIRQIQCFRLHRPPPRHLRPPPRQGAAHPPAWLRHLPARRRRRPAVAVRGRGARVGRHGDSGRDGLQGAAELGE